jgi:hypothetical protein
MRRLNWSPPCRATLPVEEPIYVSLSAKTQTPPNAERPTSNDQYRTFRVDTYTEIHIRFCSINEIDRKC